MITRIHVAVAFTYTHTLCMITRIHVAVAFTSPLNDVEIARSLPRLIVEGLRGKTQQRVEEHTNNILYDS